MQVSLASARLAGAHPSDVTIAELEAKHARKPHWRGLLAVVEGDPLHNERARLPHERGVAADGGACGKGAGGGGFRGASLSVEQQVACLLDQATDPNVLGRTWWGWKPWL